MKELPLDIRVATFTEDGNSIVAGEQRYGLAIWDATTLKLKKRVLEGLSPGQIPELAPGGKYVAILDRRNREPNRGRGILTSCRITDLETMKVGPELVEKDEEVYDYEFSAEGKVFLIVFRKGGKAFVNFWESKTSKRLASVPYSGRPEAFHTSIPNLLVMYGEDKFEIYDPFNSSVPKWKLSNAGVFWGGDVLMQRQIAVAAYEQGFLQLYDLKNSQPMQQLKGFLLGAHSAKFSQDGSRLAAGSNGAEAVKIWETETWQEVMTLSAAGSVFLEVQFSSNGKHVLGMNNYGGLFVWTAPSWEELKAHKSEVAGSK